MVVRILNSVHVRDPAIDQSVTTLQIAHGLKRYDHKGFRFCGDCRYNSRDQHSQLCSVLNIDGDYPDCACKEQHKSHERHAEESYADDCTATECIISPEQKDVHCEDAQSACDLSRKSVSVKSS